MHPRALVVEDDSRTREALRTIIQSEGFEVDTADNGELAIQLLNETRYAVVVLDVVLPRVSGTAVMEHIRVTNPDLLQNVIVVTGLAVSEIRQLFPTVFEALGKPVLPGRLRATVRNCMSRIISHTRFLSA
jgi:DNA-binding response OmpR family regulator